MTLETKSLAQMMAEPPDVSAEIEQELEYRRGFADGIGALFQQLDDLPLELDRDALMNAVWRYWGRLIVWEHSTKSETPPFEWERAGKR